MTISFSTIVLCRAVDEHRRCGSANELIGNTPQKKPIEAASTVCGHCDEVGCLRRGFCQDRLDRMPSDDNLRADAIPLLVQSFCYTLQVRLCLRLLRRFPTIARRRPGLHYPQ